MATSNDLNISEPGIVTFDGTAIFHGRTLTAGTGISITDGDGINANPIISLAGSGAAVEHLTGNSGGQLSPTANNFNTIGGGSITIAGAGSTLTTQLTGLTNHALLVGAGTTTITKLSVGTTGQLLVGASAADPAFGSSANADFTFTSATAAATRTFTVSNTDNTNTASTALLQITTGGASSGDPIQTYTVTGATSWSQGIDNSNTDAYVISQGTALGTNNIMQSTTSGEINYPLQPAFLAIGGAVNDVLGNTLTSYSLGASAVLTEIFDQNSDFSIGSGVGTAASYTAPISGKCQFNLMIQVTGIVASTQGGLQIITSNRTYTGPTGNILNMQGTGSGLRMNASVFCEMDAADTATYVMTASGEAGNIIDVLSSTVSGYSAV